MSFVSVCLFFFFKQKTAYEMAQCDWSSDVCSSDLPRRHDARSTGRAQAVVREGRHGDARECAGVERRRERPGGDVARVRQGAWAHAPRARHRLRHGRWGAEGPLLRAYRRGPKLDGEGEDADLGLRPDRGQRSVRGPGARRRARPGVGLGLRERKRGRDRVRPPDRRLRRARAHDLAVRPQGPAPDDRTRHPLLGRRQRSGPQRGDALMPVSSAVLAAQPLTLRRAGAIILGAALVAVAAQVSIPLPGTPVPLTLQPLAVLLVGGLLGPALGAASMILYLALGAAGLPVFTPYGLPGLARLIGPTGGYLLAYPVAASAVGKIAGDGRRVARLALGLLTGLALIHLGGLAQLLILTGSAASALRLGTLPFVIGDLLKLGIALLVLRPTVSPLRARL